MLRHAVRCLSWDTNRSLYRDTSTEISVKISIHGDIFTDIACQRCLYRISLDRDPLSRSLYGNLYKKAYRKRHLFRDLFTGSLDYRDIPTIHLYAKDSMSILAKGQPLGPLNLDPWSYYDHSIVLSSADCSIAKDSMIIRCLWYGRAANNGISSAIPRSLIICP